MPASEGGVYDREEWGTLEEEGAGGIFIVGTAKDCKDGEPDEDEEGALRGDAAISDESKEEKDMWGC